MEALKALLSPIKRIICSSKTWLGLIGFFALCVLDASAEDLGKYVAVILPLIIVANTSEDVTKKIGAAIVDALQKLLILKNGLKALLLCLGLGVLTSCAPLPTVRVETVYLVKPKPRAEVCVQYKGLSWCVAVDVERVVEGKE